jgi:hypothetical protein
MEKEKIIKMLTNASELEESHSSVIAKFFIEDFDWSGVDEEKVKKVKNILKLIRAQTVGHEKILNNLIGIIKDSAEDEF